MQNLPKPSKHSYYLLLLLSLFFPCCSTEKDKFYTVSAGFDYRRVPLIEPYDIICTNDYWLMKFYYNGISSKRNVMRVTELNVLDSIIILHSEKNPSTNVEPEEVWSFIIPSKKIEVKLTDKRYFLDSLSYYTPRRPTFIDIEQVWQQFDDRGELDWFPEKYKTSSGKVKN